MKLLAKSLLLCLIVFSCKEDSKEVTEVRDSYVINGTAPGIYNGVRVYLKQMDNRRRFVDRDTAIIMNEAFTFEGKVATPEKLTLHVNSVNGNLPIILENAVIDIKIDKDDILNSTVEGTKSNETYRQYLAQSKELAVESQNLNNTYRMALRDGDSASLNSSALKMQEVNSKRTNFPIEFAKSNPDSFYSLILLEELIPNNTYSFEDLNELFTSLDKELLSTNLGKKVTSLMEMKKAEAERIAAVSEGKIAPNFSGPTPNGDIISLNDIKGKATIVDFWAAWCGPCRRENPNVVKVYNKYHDKGLEIIGVSLDGNSRQANPKEAWLKAIEDDNLTWNHVSNLQYFNDPIARQYNISAIPATYILDEEGKIVAKNLRGQALETKIAEMLK